MRVRTTLLIALALTLLLSICLFADDAKWFDIEKCAFCKQLAKHPGLIEHMHNEYHKISNGIVSITTVDDDYKEAYLQSQKDMQKVAEDMAKNMAKGGEMPYMCGFCSKYGYFMMSGSNRRS